MEERNGLSRRDFLKRAAAGPLALSLAQLHLLAPNIAEAGGPALIEYSYRNWEDLYRKQWSWDKVARSTHFVNCWYQGSCAWNVYVKGGMVWKEEQAGVYPQTNPDVPDFNPRGCQKGACYSNRMYDAGRVRYPLKRVGERGEGKWKRVSWDEALTEIADAVIDTLTKEGPAAINWDLGTQASFGPQGLGFLRLAYLLDTPVWDTNPEIGDDHEGAAVTCGKMIFCSSLDDMFYSDIILIWGGNPFYTQIPNYHFFSEARYHNTKVVTISPDYSPSAIHADLWVPVRMGSDAALGLAMSQVIVSEKLYKASFLKEQTDLPFLVRSDTRLFLREADLKDGGADDVFYVYDNASKSIKAAPKDTLRLGRLEPALEGEFEADTRAGKVKVRPVFELLKERLEEYAPEKATKHCGTNPEMIRSLARQIAKAKAVTTVTTSNISKYYHGLEMERAQILVLALCGHFGSRGSGHQAFPFMIPDAIEEAFHYSSVPLPEGKKEFDQQTAPIIASLKQKAYTDELISFEFIRRLYDSKLIVSSVLQQYFHGPLKELMVDQRKWDPAMKRDLGEYVKLSLDKGWQFAYPDVTPRVILAEGGNMLRRVRGYPKMIKSLLPKLRLLVDIDWRMSNTGRHADFVLPCAAYYERPDSRWSTPLVPFFHGSGGVVEPVGEARQEWAIYCLLAKKIQQRATERKITAYKDRTDKQRSLAHVYDDLTYGGNYKEDDSAKLGVDFVKVSGNLENVTWDQLAKEGFTPYSGVGRAQASISNATDLKPNETMGTNTWHTQKKVPWPTLTRRMQFYIDHELFFELGEELPVHKEETIGGNYPLRMTGGHTRHSIHTSWRDNALMLRLQRGGPVIYMNEADARARAIQDGQRVRVYNDVGAFEIHAKTSRALRPGQVVVYHAWEPYMFKGGYSHQTLTPSPINPIELAGGYVHLRPMFFTRTPGGNDRGVRVQVEKATETEAPLGQRV